MHITKPTLIVDESQVKMNLQKMNEKCIGQKVEFRPHFKTHQSRVIGNWFRNLGISKITVSSVDMAKYFASDGWNDITIAIPVNILQLDEINELASIISLGVLLESIESAQQLVNQITNPLSVWIEIDQGYHRTGVQKTGEILEIIQIIRKSSNLTLVGLLTHAGQSYYAQSISELHNIHENSVKGLLELKEDLVKNGCKPSLKISIGDTPTCSIVNDFRGVDEIRPGNFVFFDLTQSALGVCEEAEIAIGVACPVIAKYPDRNQVVIYGGVVHLSKEMLITSKGAKTFGKIAVIGEDKKFYSIPESSVVSLSQEHGIVEMPLEIIESISIGDLLVIIPVHACITANLHSKYLTMNGEIIETIH